MAQDLLFLQLDPVSEDGFDRAHVTRILSKGATKPVTSYDCYYPDGSRGEANGLEAEDAQERIAHLGFVHFGGRMMMERIFELADTLEVFLAWSDVWGDEPQACVTRAERLARVGVQAKAALRFAVARDASHLNQLVKGTTFEDHGW